MSDIRYNVHIKPLDGQPLEATRSVQVLEDYTRGGDTIALRRTTAVAGFTAGELVATFPVGVSPLRVHLHGHAHPAAPVTLANVGPEQIEAVSRAAIDALEEVTGWEDLLPKTQERIRDAIRRALGGAR